MQAVHEKHENT